jgi:hypothetical protein
MASCYHDVFTVYIGFWAMTEIYLAIIKDICHVYNFISVLIMLL